MPYNAEISRSNPSCILFLVDQSTSMREPFYTSFGEQTKANAVAEVINKSLQTLVSKCTKSEGINDYYHIGVLGYCGTEVKPVLGGPLKDKEIVPISVLGNYPARIEKRTKIVKDARGGTVERKVNVPVWIDPVSGGGTPMCAAFARTHVILSLFLLQHPKCFPPIVIHITDGESSDGNPVENGKKLTSLKSEDGNVLLFNLHISSASPKTFEYPDSADGLPDELARELFSISSPLSSYMIKVLNDEGVACQQGARGFVFNANFQALLRFINIGTRPQISSTQTAGLLDELFSS